MDRIKHLAAFVLGGACVVLPIVVPILKPWQNELTVFGGTLLGYARGDKVKPQK